MQVWQGQYYKGNTFNFGIYQFNFNVYNASTGGVICYSNTTTLTTGIWGEWRTEQFNVGVACNDHLEDYYLEIRVNNETQSPRRLLNSFDYLRGDSPVLSSTYNYFGTARWLVRNSNGGNQSNTLFSVINNLGYILSIGITSDAYYSPENNISFANQPSVGQSSFNDLFFIGGKYTGFQWFTNPNNDTSNIISYIMGLDRYGNLNVTGNITLGGHITTSKGCTIPNANFWAERAGAITTGGAPAGLQYSFGDGNTDGGPVQPCSGKVDYLTVHAQNANNGNGRIDIVINNGVNSSCNVATPSSDGGNTLANCSLSFNSGDTLTPRTTTTPSGTNNGYVVSWWVNYD